MERKRERERERERERDDTENVVTTINEHYADSRAGLYNADSRTCWQLHTHVLTRVVYIYRYSPTP